MILLLKSNIRPILLGKRLHIIKVILKAVKKALKRAVLEVWTNWVNSSLSVGFQSVLYSQIITITLVLCLLWGFPLRTDDPASWLTTFSWLLNSFTLRAFLSFLFIMLLGKFVIRVKTTSVILLLEEVKRKRKVSFPERSTGISGHLLSRLAQLDWGQSPPDSSQDTILHN